MIEGETADNRMLSFTNWNGTTGWTLGNGIIAPLTHAFRIYDNTAGLSRFNIISGGLVGIGIDTPTARLHVVETSGSIIPVKVKVWSGTNDIVSIGRSDAGSGYKPMITSGNATDLAFGGGTNTPQLYLKYTGAGAVNAESGSVGIGTSDPSRVLHLKVPAGGAGIRFEPGPVEYPNDYSVGVNTTGFFVFQEAPNNDIGYRLNINLGGNVGISQTDPSMARLVVKDAPLGTGGGRSILIDCSGVERILGFYNRSNLSGQLASIRHADGTTRLGIWDDSNLERFSVITEAGPYQGNVGIGVQASGNSGGDVELLTIQQSQNPAILLREDADSVGKIIGGGGGLYLQSMVVDGANKGGIHLRAPGQEPIAKFDNSGNLGLGEIFESNMDISGTLHLYWKNPSVAGGRQLIFEERDALAGFQMRAPGDNIYFTVDPNKDDYNRLTNPYGTENNHKGWLHQRLEI